MKKFLQALIYIAIPVLLLVLLYRLMTQEDETEVDYDFDNPDVKVKPGDYSRAGVKEKSSKKSKPDIDLTKRQRELYAFIQTSGNTAMNQIQKRFNKVSSRTLRRDLNRLASLDMIIKRGTTRSTSYFAS